MFAVLTAVGIDRFPRRFRPDLSRQDATEATQRMKAGDWGTAGRLLVRARAYHPNDPTVIRALAEWEILTGGHPDRIIQGLKRLVDRQMAIDEDVFKIARAYRQLGLLEVASAWLDRLSAGERGKMEVMEFETELLRDAGHTSEAESRLRAVLEKHRSEPDAQFKMAVLDYSQALSVIRERGRARLFEEARAGGDRGLLSLGLLSKDPALTSVEATEIMRLARGTKPAALTARYAALTALLKSQSDKDTAQLIAKEAKRAAPQNEATRLAFVNAVAAGLSAIDLSNWVDAELRKPNNPLLRELLHLKFYSLARQENWKQIKKLLDVPIVQKLGTVPLHLWHACADAHLQTSMQSAREHLHLAVAACRNPLVQSDMIRCGETAMTLGVWDIAATVFGLAAADLSVLPPVQIALLEKAEEAQERAGNTAALLSTARLVAQNPAARAHHIFRADYLALLAGEPLDPIVSRLVGIAEETEPSIKLRNHFLWAMIFHRRKQWEHLRKELQNVVVTDLKTELPPGPRAVLAVLFAINGDASRANQIAQGVPNSMLLPEEKAWLDRAR